MLYWSRPSSIIVMILVFQVSCLLISPSVLVQLYYRDHAAQEIIGKHALLVQSRLHYCDDSCFTSCLFADFTKCRCVALLQRSCCTGNSWTRRSVNMLYWFSPGSIIVTILLLQVACLLISPSVLVYLYCREIIGKHKQAKGNDCDFFLQSAHLPYQYFLK